MKKIFTAILIVFSFTVSGQSYIKINTLSALVGMPNIAYETKIADNYTFQADVLISPWEALGNLDPFKFAIINVEARYYTREVFSGFYFGVNGGGTFYEFQKWNYINTDAYQKGMGYMFGATLGYQFKLSEKFNLDLFFGGGWHLGFYKGYSKTTGIRYDEAVGYNKSGEWFPYKGGLFLSYKL